MEKINLEFVWEELPDFLSSFKKQIGNKNDRDLHSIYQDVDYDDDDDIVEDEESLPSNFTAFPLPFELKLSGHTLDVNFVITHHILQILLASEGLEAVKVLSPYKVKIFFGKCWKNKEEYLKKNIEKKIRLYMEAVYNN